MLIGHFGLALGAKPVARKPSLGLLIFAAQFADLLWPLLLLLGVEKVRVVPGLHAASPFDFIDYPITHSLLMQLVWGALLGGIYFLWRKDLRGGLVVGLLVASHWMLDLIVHGPDLPLWPGGPKLGLGLWGSIPGTVLAEALVFGAGVWIYARATEAIDRVGRWAFASLVAGLVLLYVGALLGPPPADPVSVAAGALSLWIFVPWGVWVDRHRALRATL